MRPAESPISWARSCGTILRACFVRKRPRITIICRSTRPSAPRASRRCLAAHSSPACVAAPLAVSSRATRIPRNGPRSPDACTKPNRSSTRQRIDSRVSPSAQPAAGTGIVVVVRALVVVEVLLVELVGVALVEVVVVGCTVVIVVVGFVDVVDVVMLEVVVVSRVVVDVVVERVVDVVLVVLLVDVVVGKGALRMITTPP